MAKLILVCGSRRFKDDFKANLFIRNLMIAMKEEGVTHIIHGDAQGADKMAAQAAVDLGMEVTAFPADWETHGRRAGVIRNQAMLEAQPHGVVAFWDGESKGTFDMINRAAKAQVPTQVIRMDALL